MNTAPKGKSFKSNQTRTALGFTGALALFAAIPFATTASNAADAPPSRVDALVNFEFANEYLTPRGMIVTDKGLTFQPLVLGLVNAYKGEGFFSDVTLVGGVWNDFSSAPVSIHPPFGSSPKDTWVEIDPIAGISVGFAKYLKLDITYTAFKMQILDIGTSQHLETKLSLNDSDLLKAFALHPYVSLWQELEGKATDADVPAAVFGAPGAKGKYYAPGSSYYIELGVDPSYTIAEAGGLKFEAPCRVLLPDSRFYGEYFAKSSTIGLWEVGIKATIPMNFMPDGYGHWSFHAGFKEMYFVDNNLYNLNIFNAPGKPTRDSKQVYLGVSVFF